MSFKCFFTHSESYLCLFMKTWTARRSNQSILREISPGISLEGMMLKLKLQYFAYLMWSVDSLEKTLMLGRIGGQEEKWMTEDEIAGWHHWLDGHDLSEFRELVMDREVWRAVIHVVAKSRTRVSNWSDLVWSASAQFQSFHSLQTHISLNLSCIILYLVH